MLLFFAVSWLFVGGSQGFPTLQIIFIVCAFFGSYKFWGQLRQEKAARQQ
jgi:hypothetical protein